MPSSRQRILILSAQSLFAQAMCSLLQERAFDVLGVETCGDDTVARVQELRPDVIILDDTGLPPLLLCSLLDCVPTVRIIRVMLEGSLMRVYERHQSNAYRAQDFLDALGVTEPPGFPCRSNPPNEP